MGFKKYERIVLPSSGNVSLCLLLAFQHPMPIVTLSDLHSPVTEKRRYPLNRDAIPQETGRKRMAKLMGMAVRDRGEGEQSFQASLPNFDSSM